MRFLDFSLLNGLACTFAFLVGANAARAVQSKYIVALKPNIEDSSLLPTFSRLAVPIEHTFRIGSFRGYAARLTTATAAALSEDPRVAYVAPNTIVRTTSLIVQTPSEYSLIQISHQKNSTAYAKNYVFDSSGGEGTCVYVIDSGINTQHPEFEGRASRCASFINGTQADDNGHGTHVAGSIGSRAYGVAKKTKLYDVRVFNANGSGTAIPTMKAIQFALGDALKARKDGRCPKGVVFNMSFSTSLNPALNDAAREVVEAGVFVAVGAGNDGARADAYSPASEPSLCTVGAVDRNKQLWNESNYGPLVDVFAPGHEVRSTSRFNGSEYRSGTSMATAHLSGLAAYFLGLNTTREDSKNGTSLCKYIQSLSSKGVIKGPSERLSNNLLVYNGNGLV